jgi:nitrite reductase/ring-hydroxylating ferredoxin subunit
MSDFTDVADADSLPPGHGRTVHVRGREFAIWNFEGQFHCLDDVCPHRGASLGAGMLDAGTVYCPLHGWGFDVRTGACTTGADRSVETHPTRVENGKVQIQL